MPIIGIDIGGSHISSAVVSNQTLSIVEGTYFKGAIDSKASKEAILKGWAQIIKQTLSKLDASEPIGIAFSMPGPFEYESGIAMFKGNDKYEALYGVNIPRELSEYLNAKNVTFRFLNDATAFGIGSALTQKDGGANKKVIAITLGTGFGASFLDDVIPVTMSDDAPENGCLWDKPFEDGIADSYFSTRWFLAVYEKYTGQRVQGGVKEIADIKNEHTARIFNEFALNLGNFLIPHVLKFNTDLLILGGNIAKCHALFLPRMLQVLSEHGIEIPVNIIDKTEEAGIIGASYIFNEAFWERIKEELPNF